jgi:hypothetical protein
LNAGYRRLLGGFLFLLQHGSKPFGVQDFEFLRMRPAIESLVEREIFKPEALAVFREVAAAAGN